MFDPSAAGLRLARLWNLGAHFGTERGNNRIFLDEIVSDRMQLISGLQVVRDELQFASAPTTSDREACTADFAQASVVTTLAFTNCGDRIHHGEMEHYQRVVATRFATLSEVGTLKPEAFYPTGGGTDNGPTLAHVTWAHVLDDTLRQRLYDGNKQSFVMCAFDLKTHVGIRSAEGVEITAAVAGSIVAVQGMLDTARALTSEMDERGLAHLTASMTVNRPDGPDTMVYLARATVFAGELVTQGFGVDASKYTGRVVKIGGEERLELSYDGVTDGRFPLVRETYDTRQSVLPGDIFV